MKVKTLLIGSGDFAIPIFKAALEADFLEVVGIVTQPDKPFGRTQELKGSAVFEALKEATQITWFKPTRFRNEYEDMLAKTNPDLVLVASYGQILPKEFIEYPRHKALNFHGSILPQLRGAVPVPMAILQGLTETGVTLQVMSEGMDEGDVVSIAICDLNGTETTQSLMQNLAELGVGMLQNELPKYLSSELHPTPQDHSKATYCYKTDIEKEKAEITFETDITLAERMIRAFYPWPIAYVMIEGKMLKIYKAKIHSKNVNSSNNLQIRRDGKSLLLELSSGTLELLEVQLEGKKRDNAKNYLFLAN